MVKRCPIKIANRGPEEVIFLTDVHKPTVASILEGVICTVEVCGAEQQCFLLLTLPQNWPAERTEALKNLFLIVEYRDSSGTHRRTPASWLCTFRYVEEKRSLRINLGIQGMVQAITFTDLQDYSLETGGDDGHRECHAKVYTFRDLRPT